MIDDEWQAVLQGRDYEVNWLVEIINLFFKWSKQKAQYTMFSLSSVVWIRMNSLGWNFSQYIHRS